MYSSNIILTHTLYILVATNNINLFARIYHVTRRTPTNRKAPLHRFRYQWPSTNASHAGSPKSCRVIQTVVEKEILGNDASRQSWHRFCVNGWTLMTNFNMHGIYLMCISSICLCVVVFLQVTDIWAMVTWYLSCKWYFHTVPNTAKGANGDRDIRTSNQSHTKYYVRVYHYIFFFCKHWSFFQSHVISLITNTSTFSYQSAMLLHPWSATTVSSHRYTFRSVLRRRKECRDTSQQQVTSLYVYDFEIIPTAGTFWVRMFPLVFLLFWNHNMVYMPCFWLIVMAQHMP